MNDSDLLLGEGSDVDMDLQSDDEDVIQSKKKTESSGVTLVEDDEEVGGEKSENHLSNNSGQASNTPIPTYPAPVYDPSLPSCRVQFSTLCKYFEKLSENNKHKEKKAILDKIFLNCKADLFQFMRLLLPQLDRERLTYGLKESKIAKHYIEILALPANCEDAQRLKKWKDPSKGTGNSFSDICFHVLQKRGWNSSSNRL